MLYNFSIEKLVLIENKSITLTTLRNYVCITLVIAWWSK